MFLKREDYAIPNGPYHGALWFDPASIQVFDPVNADVIRQMWPQDFTGFSNASRSLEPEAYTAFEQRLTGIEAPPRTIRPDSTDLNDYAIENRKLEIEQRQKQSLFRARILQNFEGRCCLSEISEAELLVASHIVPWAKRVETRLDPANGLLLYCPYDRLFDKGFISFDDSLRVVVAPWGGQCSLPLRGILEKLSGQQARLPVKWAIKTEYLTYHRTEVLRLSLNERS